MSTQDDKFKEYLEKLGFILSPVLQTFLLNPSLYKQNGNLILLSNIHVCVFKGANTKDTEVGCVTFCINGKIKEKYKRNAYDYEFEKKAVVCKTTKEAIEAFEKWTETTQSKMSSMSKIM